MRLGVFFYRLVTFDVNYLVREALIYITRINRVTRRRQPPSFHTKEKKVIMKKFIQIFSLFGLLVVFGTISASAQAGLGTEVEIPFAFNIGDTSYDAGNYIIRIDRRITGASTLVIRDTKTDEQKLVLLNANSEGGSGEIKLVFDTVEGRRYLTKVRTPERSYALYRGKIQKDAAKARGSAGAVSVGAGS